MSSSSVGAASSQLGARWFPELEGRESPFHRSSSWSEGDLNYFLLTMDRFEPLSPFERERAEAMLEKTYPLIAKKAFIERVRREFKALKNPKEDI